MPAMQSGCLPAAPITPPQDLERLQRGELPAPKALEQQFDGLAACEDTSPRSPLGTSHSSNPGHWRPAAQAATTTAAAATAAAAAAAARQRQKRSAHCGGRQTTTARSPSCAPIASASACYPSSEWLGGWGGAACGQSMHAVAASPLRCLVLWRETAFKVPATQHPSLAIEPAPRCSHPAGTTAPLSTTSRRRPASGLPRRWTCPRTCATGSS